MLLGWLLALVVVGILVALAVFPYLGRWRGDPDDRDTGRGRRLAIIVVAVAAILVAQVAVTTVGGRALDDREGRLRRDLAASAADLENLRGRVVDGSPQDAAPEDLDGLTSVTQLRLRGPQPAGADRVMLAAELRWLVLRRCYEITVLPGGSHLLDEVRCGAGFS